jgi:hypothetical protein
MAFDCLPMHSKCKAMCCMAAPIEKEVYERNRHRLVRKTLQEIEFDGFDQLDGKVKTLITPVTEDMHCPFLREDLLCNIYDDRPAVCKHYGSEAVPCLRCPFQAKDGRTRSRQETRSILRQAEKDKDKLIKEGDRMQKLALAEVGLNQAQQESYGECGVLISIDMGRWHMSISHPKRYPSWDEIKGARYKFLPTHIHVAMILPPPSEYVNLHPNCFHLWEVQDPLANQIWAG